MVMINKKFGYTLAEVMITLSLIGVLATLTISTIGSGVQERARLAEFKTAYARMETVLKNITIEHGSVYACYSNSSSGFNEFGIDIGNTSAANGECPELEREFVKAMGVTRACPSNNPILGTNYPNLANDCIPNDYPKNNFGDQNGHSYVFDNGMLMLTKQGRIIFALDFNGRSGPNKWGQDIFPFSIVASSVLNGRVNEVKILPPHPNEDPLNGVTNVKTTAQMMREAAGRKD